MVRVISVELRKFRIVVLLAYEVTGSKQGAQAVPRSARVLEFLIRN
jgi:hypothetical protein